MIVTCHPRKGVLLIFKILNRSDHETNETFDTSEAQDTKHTQMLRYLTHTKMESKTGEPSRFARLLS